MNISTIIYYVHFILIVFFMFGGMFQCVDKKSYLIVAKLIVLGWIVFNGCILNKGQGYPDNSFSKKIFKDMGFPSHNNGDKFTMSLICMSIFNSIRVTKDYSILYLLAICYLKKSLYKKI